MVLDIIVLLIGAFAFRMGYTQGVIKAIFTILGIMIGLLFALKLSPVVINFLERMLNQENVFLFLGGFILTYGIILFIIWFTGNRLEHVFTSLKINFINKIVGGAILTLVFLVGFGYLVWFLERTKLIGQNTKTSSFSYPALAKIPEETKSILTKTKPLFKEFWSKSVKIAEGLKEAAEQTKQSENATSTDTK